MPLTKLSLCVLLAYVSLVDASALAKQRSLESYGDKSIVKLLAVGQVEALNQLQPEIEKTLELRLYRVPKSGDCVPETKMVCSYDYYLAVSEYDEDPKQAVFNPGTYGSIAQVMWLPTKTADSAKLEVSFSELPPEAAQRLKNARRKTYKEVWEINSKNMLIKRDS